MPPNKAIVGRNAFRHASGIHQDGVLKHRATYEAIDPAEIGHPTGTEIVLGKLSGRHGFASRAQALGIAFDGEALDRAFARFQALADERGEVGDGEIRALFDAARGRRRERGLSAGGTKGDPLERDERDAHHGSRRTSGPAQRAGDGAPRRGGVRGADRRVGACARSRARAWASWASRPRRSRSRSGTRWRWRACRSSRGARRAATCSGRLFLVGSVAALITGPAARGSCSRCSGRSPGWPRTRAADGRGRGELARRGGRRAVALGYGSILWGYAVGQRRVEVDRVELPLPACRRRSRGCASRRSPTCTSARSCARRSCASCSRR